jgi:hypothetical protein
MCSLKLSKTRKCMRAQDGNWKQTTRKKEADSNFLTY